MPDVYPFDFVPYPSSIERSAPPDHDAFGGHSGTLSCSLEALSPFLIMGEERAESGTGRFQQDDFGRYVIPGSSLKGMVRSVFEAIVPSCVRTVAGKNRKYVSKAVSSCSRRNRLCPACRTFGMLDRGEIHKGVVNVGEAHAVEPKHHGMVVTDSLWGPNPDKSWRYGSPNDPAGRKFYFHHQDTPEAQYGGNNVIQLEPLGAGSRFQFDVTFENLTQELLRGLVASLVLSDRVDYPEALAGGEEAVAIRHKLGYGKPIGFGSVKISIDRAEVDADTTDRYRSFSSSPEVYEGDELDAWIEEQRRPYFEKPSKQVRELARILRYPQRPGTFYTYYPEDE